MAPRIPGLPGASGIVAALALMLALVGSIGTGAGALAEDGGGSTLTIRARACPPGYDGTDYYAACTNALAGVTFIVAPDDPAQRSSAVTDAGGVAVVAGIAAQAPLVQADIPGDFLDGYAVFCGAEQGDPIGVTYAQGGVVVDLVPVGGRFACDWFVIPTDQGAPDPGTPADAALVVRAFGCPVGFAGETFDPCYATPLAGVTFTAALVGADQGIAATTAANGVVALTLPAATLPGDYSLFADIPGEFAEFRTYCSNRDGSVVNFSVAGNGITIPGFVRGDWVTCDWFVIPEDLRGETPTPTPGATRASLTIHNRLCPEGFAGSDYYANCHHTPAPAGLEFAVEGAAALVGTTDGAGNLVFDLAPGEYAVRGGVPGEFATLVVYCAPVAAPGTPFAFTPLGNGTRGPNDLTGIVLALAAGDAVVCDWYNTPENLRGEEIPPTAAPAPAPTARAGGGTGTNTIVTLPNTGVGSPNPGLLGAGGTALLVLTGGLAALGAGAIRRRRAA